jgi:hypothetical protein
LVGELSVTRRPGPITPRGCAAAWVERAADAEQSDVENAWASLDHHVGAKVAFDDCHRQC